MSPASARIAPLRTVALAPGADFEGFRAAARTLAPAAVPPEAVAFVAQAAPGLFASEASDATTASPLAPPLALPRPAVDLARLVVCHRDPERYALLYALFWRLLHGERRLLEVASDPLVHRLNLMRKAIARDLHKMHAFLRFRRVPSEDRERFVAWFEPDDHILGAAAPFFVDRFRSLDWSILTPEGSAHWDGTTLRFGPPGRREDAPPDDAFEAGWLGYYESTFNPARTNLTAMRAEMPKKYWRNMPEALAIPALVRDAPRRVAEMIEREARDSVKREPTGALKAMHAETVESLEALNAIIARTEPLVPGATRAVLGEGPLGATVAFVGEQPGDQEDRQGRPFVGPAGQLLSRALAEAGIARETSYLTNAVKHFKFEQRGPRRIHQKPTAGEVSHYRWWLDKELDFVAPKLVVALGATAVLALTGKAVPVTRSRGPFDFGNRHPFRGFVTVHPSYLLRLPDEDAKAEGYAAFVQDLTRVRDIAAEWAGG